MLCDFNFMSQDKFPYPCTLSDFFSYETSYQEGTYFADFYDIFFTSANARSSLSRNGITHNYMNIY